MLFLIFVRLFRFQISFVEGKFEGNEDAAVVILEKTPFSEEMCTKILKTQEGPEKDAIPEEIFRNDIYSGYLLRPERSLNGTMSDG